MRMCRIHIGGSWQKRSHSSMKGYFAGVNNSKVINRHGMSKYCKQCQFWEHKKDTDEYENYKYFHICSINHQKSSGAMESTGAIELFRRCVSTNNLIYSEYLGDGDTSSFTDTFASKPYEKYNIDPVKLECVGHVQKRMRTRLYNLRNSTKVNQHLFMASTDLQTKLLLVHFKTSIV